MDMIAYYPYTPFYPLSPYYGRMLYPDVGYLNYYKYYDGKFARILQNVYRISIFILPCSVIEERQRRRSHKYAHLEIKIKIFSTLTYNIN